MEVPSNTSLNWKSFGGTVGVCPVDVLTGWDELLADMAIVESNYVLSTITGDVKSY
jgi:hypothetical protein